MKTYRPKSEEAIDDLIERKGLLPLLIFRVFPIVLWMMILYAVITAVVREFIGL